MNSKNKKRIKESIRLEKWKKKNKDKWDEHQRNYYHRHKEETKQRRIKSGYRDKYNKIRRSKEYKKDRNAKLKVRRKTDLQFCLNDRMSSNIRKALKGKKAGRHWETLVGYTVNDLIKHLEKLFDSKMNWNNYGTYWEIDHIKPKSLFNYTKLEDEGFKKCWGLENLQPLEKMANMIKSNKYVVKIINERIKKCKE